MTVGVVSHDAVTQPENMGNAEVGAEIPFDFGPVELGISIRIQETGFGGEQRAVK